MNRLLEWLDSTLQEKETCLQEAHNKDIQMKKVNLPDSDNQRPN